jgi:hypothetical protein
MQTPLEEAYERNDAAIAHWLSEEYPGLARQAKQEKAVIYWGDEMGLRSDHIAGTSYAPLGKTPLVRATGQRFGCNMISAITNRGHLAFMVFHGKFDARLFVGFMQRLIKQAATRVYLIVDGHPVHRSSVAKRFVEDNVAKLRLIRLPGYCPELNPDEPLNQDVKTNALGKSRPTNRTEMMAACDDTCIADSANRRSFAICLRKSMSNMPPDLLRTICWPAQYVYDGSNRPATPSHRHLHRRRGLHPLNGRVPPHRMC